MVTQRGLARGTLVFALLIAFSGTPRAEEGDAPLRPAAAARAVIAALEAGDKPALEALAEADDPDPWRVAEALLDSEALAAAQAFAAASPRPETKGLPAYVATTERTATVSDALTAFDGAANAESPSAAAAGYRIAADRADSIGWRVLQSEALYQGGLSAWSQGAFREVGKWFGEHLEVEEGLASDMGLGRAHFRVSAVLFVLGEVDDAGTHRAQAERYATASGDIYYLAKIRADEAVDEGRAGDVEAARDIFAEVDRLLETYDSASLPRRFRPSVTSVISSRVSALTNASSLSAKLGADDQSRVFARKAVAVARASPNPEELDRTRALLARIDGVRHQVAGRLLEAAAQFERARGLYERLGQREILADVLRRLGDVQTDLTDLPTALETIETAIEILIESGARRELIKARLSAAAVCRDLDRGQEALAHSHEALRLARLLKEPALIADALNGLALGHRSRQELGESVEYLDEAMRVHKAHPGRTDPTGTQSHFADYMASVGDIPGAFFWIDKVIAQWSGGPFKNRLADARRFRAELLVHVGDVDEGLEELERVLVMRQNDAHRRGTADMLATVGRIVLRRYGPGDAERARDLYGKAAGHYVALRDDANEIYARIGMGRAALWDGDFEGAVEELSYADERAAEEGDIKLRAHTLQALAEAHTIGKRYDEAIASAMEGSDLLANYALDLEEGSQSLARSEVKSITTWGTAAAASKGDRAALYQFLERGRASALVASLGGRAALREARVPRELRFAEDKARAESALALRRYRNARNTGRRPEIRAARDGLDETRARERDAVAAIQRTVRSEADLAYSAPVPLKHVRKALAPDEVMVLYGWTGWNYVAEVVTKKKSRIVILGAEAIEANAALIGNPNDADALAALRKALIDPLQLDKRARRLLVSPVGTLLRVPFSLLVPSKDVCLVPSATAWFALRKASHESGTEVLAIGDPTYDGTAMPRAAHLRALRDTPLVPLPGTREEASRVGDEVLLGADASETRFREIVAKRPRWRSVHFACHSLVDPVFATRSALALVGDEANDGLLHANELFDQLRISTDLVVLSGCETARGSRHGGEGLQGLSRAFMLGGAPRVIASLWKVDDDATRALMIKFYELWNPRAKPGNPELVGGSGSPNDPGPTDRPDPVEVPQRKGISAAAALRQAQAFVRGHEKWAKPEYWAAWVLWGLP